MGLRVRYSLGSWYMSSAMLLRAILGYEALGATQEFHCSSPAPLTPAIFLRFGKLI